MLWWYINGNIFRYSEMILDWSHVSESSLMVLWDATHPRGFREDWRTVSYSRVTDRNQQTTLQQSHTHIDHNNSQDIPSVHALGCCFFSFYPFLSPTPVSVTGNMSQVMLLPILCFCLRLWNSFNQFLCACVYLYLSAWIYASAPVAEHRWRVFSLWFSYYHLDFSLKGSITSEVQFQTCRPGCQPTPATGDSKAHKQPTIPTPKLIPINIRRNCKIIHIPQLLVLELCHCS